MISDEVRREGLAALSVAAAELIEDSHDRLVTTLPDDPEVQCHGMERLRRLGQEVVALGEAGLVLLESR